MSTPSQVLDSIVTTLGARLAPGNVAVIKHDGPFNVDTKENITFPAPCVLVFCDQLPLSPAYNPALTDAIFVAVCLARGGQGTLTRADAAMDMAGLVASIAGSERWGTCFKVPSKVRATNEHSHDLSRKGLSAWSVMWTQQVQLTVEDEAAALHKLRTMTFEHEVGGVDTPDLEATLAFPETP
jgi:hypothetical protein